MKILALDSSGLVASVAVVENDNLIAEYSLATVPANRVDYDIFNQKEE